MSQQIVQTADLVDGLVTSAKLGNGAVGPTALGAINGNGIGKDGSSLLVVLADGGTLSVGAQGVKVAAGGISSNELNNAAVSAGKIAAGGVSQSNQLAAGVVDATALATGAVTSTKIGAGAVGETAIADAAVTSAKVKLDSGTWHFSGGATVQVPDLAGGANGLSAVNKNYADSIAAGLDIKQSCYAATTGPLPQNVYDNGTAGVGATLTGSANGALGSIDGQATTVGKRILVKNEGTEANNGIYTVTTVGDPGTKYVLTRATDFNSNKTITPGSFTFIEQGNANADTGWVLVTDGTVDVGQTSLSFTLFSTTAQLSYNAPLSKVGSAVSLLFDNTTVGVNGSNQLAVKDGGIGATQLGANAVTTAKINDGSVTYAKLASDAKLAIGRFDTAEILAVTTNGQTVFTLASAAQSAAGATMLFVNGLLRKMTDYTVSGTTLTLTGLAVNPGAEVVIFYGTAN